MLCSYNNIKITNTRSFCSQENFKFDLYFSFIKPPLATARAFFMRRACPSVRLSVYLFVCLSLNCKNAIFSKTKTKQFRAMVSIDDLYEVVHRLFKEPIIGPLKSKMAEIRHFENRHDIIIIIIIFVY